MTGMTGQEADDNSIRRQRITRRRVTTLALFVLFAMLVFALLLQRQIQRQADYVAEQAKFVHIMCLQRQKNTIKTNTIWASLAKIEQHNKFIDDKLREERQAVYATARLEVPDCSKSPQAPH